MRNINLIANINIPNDITLDADNIIEEVELEVESDSD